MNKKLLIYGLAFGSASAALSYVHYASAIYKSSGVLQLLAMLSEVLIIPGIGIYLFLKAFRTDNPEQFNMGRAIFLSFFLSVIMSAAVSLVFSYIYQFRQELVVQIVNYKTELYSKTKAALELKAKGAAVYEKDVKAYSDLIRTEIYSMGAQFKLQLFMGASRGLLLGAIMAYIMRPKTPRKD